MKTLIVMFLICVKVCNSAEAQSQEAQQLLLNWEKLAQLKSILNNMYEGYRVISQGYEAVKNLAEGNFSLHQGFLNGLLEVSPTVRKYKRIAEIVNMQKLIAHEGKQAYRFFNNSGHFKADELRYLQNVYANLLKQSIKNLDELFMIVAAGTLRMNDDERLDAIDRLFDTVQDQLAFLRTFNNGASLLLTQRAADKKDHNLAIKLEGK
jgi:hypothetical protein